MFLVELIASSFLDLISKQARPKRRCKRVLVLKPNLLITQNPDAEHRTCTALHKTLRAIQKQVH